jgi:hypothetical protein
MGARYSSQLEPLEQAMGWRLSNDAMEEIDRIVRTTVTDPVGPEFMAPPTRSHPTLQNSEASHP